MLDACECGSNVCESEWQAGGGSGLFCVIGVAGDSGRRMRYTK